MRRRRCDVTYSSIACKKDGRAQRDMNMRETSGEMTTVEPTACATTARSYDAAAQEDGYLSSAAGGSTAHDDQRILLARRGLEHGFLRWAKGLEVKPVATLCSRAC